MIKLFQKLTKKDMIWMLACLLFVVFQVWLELKIPDYMSKITTLLQDNATSMQDILKEGSLMLLCAFLSLAASIFVGYIAATVSSNFSMHLRSAIFQKVETFGIAEMKKFQTSSLITRTTNDVTQMEMLIAMGLQALMKAPIMAIWAVSKILNKSMELSALTGACVVILLLSVFVILMIVLPRFEKVQKLIDKINLVTRENLTGIRVVRAFNAERYQEDRFQEVNRELTKNQLFNQRCFAFLMPIMNVVMHGLTLGIYFIGAALIVRASLSDKITIFSNVVVFSSYGMQVIMSFLMLSMIFMIVPRAAISARRINEVLEATVSIQDGAGKEKETEKGTITFDHVSFKYPDADEYVLQDISFQVKQGETVAFIGSTGSGKSTLINLVPRFYDATEGKILLDGIDVKDYPLHELNNKIGYVAQKAFLFDATILENIAYGENGHSKTEEEVKEAIRIAQAEDFVLKLEDTYNAHIARGGTNISGGQKQRLSIARAIAKKPEIYIFDDSFSALDFKTDAALRKALKKSTKDITTLIVAQRIGTIMHADQIVVLEKGRCVGIGKHEELLKNCEVYKEIALSQLGEEEMNHA